jgi:hypothetical protein
MVTSIPTRRREQQQMARTASGWMAERVAVVVEGMGGGLWEVEGFLDFDLWLVYEDGLNFCKLAAGTSAGEGRAAAGEVVECGGEADCGAGV